MKIVAALFRYDYGRKERGDSGEKLVIYPALRKAEEAVVPFWLEDNGYPDDLPGLQEKLVRFVEAERAALVFFVFLTNEISPETLHKINATCATMNWFCDDQWRFESFTRFVAPLLSYSVTVDKYSLAKYEKIGVRKVLLSQWAAARYDESALETKEDYLYDVSFVGEMNPTRAWVVGEMHKRGVEVVCFGNGWASGRVDNEEMNVIFRRSRINLNLSNSVPRDYRFYFYLVGRLFAAIIGRSSYRNQPYFRSIKKSASDIYHMACSKKMVEQIKARNFEIPGAGGFELSQFALGIDDYYTLGREIAVFSSIDELHLQIVYYLANSEERDRVRAAGYRRTARYTYPERFRELFAQVRPEMGRIGHTGEEA